MIAYLYRYRIRKADLKSPIGDQRVPIEKARHSIFWTIYSNETLATWIVITIAIWYWYWSTESRFITQQDSEQQSMFVSKIVFRLVNCHLMNSNLVSQRRWNNSNNLIFSTWKFIVLFSLSDHSLLSKNTIGKEESTFHVSRKYFFFLWPGIQVPVADWFPVKICPLVAGHHFVAWCTTYTCGREFLFQTNTLSQSVVVSNERTAFMNFYLHKNTECYMILFRVQAWKNSHTEYTKYTLYSSTLMVFSTNSSMRKILWSDQGTNL